MKYTGAQSIKLEGGKEFYETIYFLSQRGIPVMGHIGLMPQRIQTLGGFITQGKTKSSSNQVVEDAKAIIDAGVYSMVIEAVPEETSKIITEKSPVPTIGIGAGRTCDGQILVTHDILGLFGDFTPRFVKKYAELDKNVTQAIKQYASEVREKKFPSIENTFKTSK